MRLGYRHFLRHWFVAALGMAIGAGIAVRMDSHLPLLGDMHIIEMSAAAILLLLLAGLVASRPEDMHEPAVLSRRSVPDSTLH